MPKKKRKHPRYRPPKKDPKTGKYDNPCGKGFAPGAITGVKTKIGPQSGRRVANCENIGGKKNNEQTLTDFQQNPYAFGKTAADVADAYGEADLYAMQQMRLEGRRKKRDPKVGTGKKPKGSGRRLYTDENPKDTVSVEFKSAAAIKRTLAKPSFKRKSHKRQSQIINLIHQRARAAFRNAKDPKVKARLKRAYKYATERKEASKRKTQRMRKRKNELSILEATYGNIDEYVVPMGYSLEKWLKKKKKEKLTNKEYADETTGDKWKVVHGKTRPARKGKGGRKLKPTKRGSVINKSAKNLSYKKATNLHTAIELSD